MRFNRKLAVAFAVIVGLALFTAYMVLPMFMQSPEEPEPHTSSNYWVAINPTTPDSPMYTSAGQNWTFAYEAVWSFGDKAGQRIENATATIQVTSAITDQTIDTLYVNTTSGIFSFNYAALTADILSFNATKLTTQEGKEYGADVFDVEAGVWGLQPESATVWYDTFHVELVDSDTTTLAATKVSVNVTYALLPEEGLTLPSWATYSGQTFLPKIVHGQTITVNGVQSQETATPGIYTAEVGIWFPTAYIHVAAAQQNWTTTHTGFSFAHAANLPMWIFAAAFSGLALTAAVALKMIQLRKSGSGSLTKRSNLPFLAGILLAVASLISLYWAAVGVDSTLAGFDWAMLAGLGLVSCVFGFAGATMAFKRKYQAFVISSVILPVIVNSVVVKAELGVYQLATPWMTLIGAFAIALISSILITNSEKQATQQQQE